jgi:multidrug transporter EmrE-like cation transporter
MNAASLIDSVKSAMSVEDLPEYSISKFILGSLFFAAAISFLIWAGHELFAGRPYAAMKGAGIALVLFSGCVDPKRFYGDCLSFPYRFVASSGRDTTITMLGALLGSLLFAAGWLLDLYASQLTT